MRQGSEELSAFFDGESQIDVKQVSNDQAAVAKWSRYQLLRDHLQGETLDGYDSGLVDKIAAALDDEPVILNRFSKRQWIKQNLVNIAKQSSQFAVAASVAAAMIIGVQQYNYQPAQELLSAPTVAGPQGGLSPVSLSTSRTIPQQDVQQVMAQRKRINALLLDHQEQRQRKADQQDEQTAADK